MNKLLKKKKIEKAGLIGLICSIILVMGISYAVWDYVFIGNANIITTGNISLDLLESNTNIITIENALPMSDNTGKAQTDTFDFAVTSKTKQSIDIGYSIILEKLTVDSGYTSLEDGDIKLYLTNFTGTELLEPVTINRIKDKVIYENTHTHDSSHETIQDKFKLRVWIDENVDASDWNAETKLQYKFRIGVRENKEVHLHGLLYNIVADGAELDTNVDFKTAPTGHNKKYTFSSTKDDKYPVHYYRGEVDNNFVKFGGFCWRAVRTTSTGGTKLIYSGAPEEKFEMINLPQSDYTIVTNNGWTFDSSDNSWNSELTENGGSNILDVSLPKGSYTVKVVGSSTPTTGGSIYIIKDSKSLYSYSISNSDSFDKTYNLENSSDSDVVEFRFVGGGDMSNGPIVIKIQVQSSNSLGIGCPVNGSSTQIDSLRIPGDSQAYIGYMYGTVYKDKFEEPISGSKFGKSFTYNDGTYTLTDTVIIVDNTHHYTCNNASGTCSTVRYYYYSSGGYHHYIDLTGGEGAQDALRKMQVNSTDSKIKTKIDSWYANNMISYTNKLEDTPWCNDRSMQTTTNGWYENGKLNEFIYYGSNGRVGTVYNSINPTFMPSLNCPNKNDAFTVSDTAKGNGALDYPIALLTADELTMAGSGTSGYSDTSYLNTNQYPMSLSPHSFQCGENSSEDCDLYFFSIRSDGRLSSLTISLSIRPSISLKVGTIVKDGSGTYDDPMIVE